MGNKKKNENFLYFLNMFMKFSRFDEIKNDHTYTTASAR